MFVSLFLNQYNVCSLGVFIFDNGVVPVDSTMLSFLYNHIYNYIVVSRLSSASGG